MHLFLPMMNYIKFLQTTKRLMCLIGSIYVLIITLIILFLIYYFYYGVECQMVKDKLKHVGIAKVRLNLVDDKRLVYEYRIESWIATEMHLNKNAVSHASSVATLNHRSTHLCENIQRGRS